MAKRHNEPYRLYKRGETYHAYISFISETRGRIILRESTRATREREAINYCLKRLSELQKQDRQQTSGELPCLTLNDAFTLFYQKHAQYYARPDETLRKLILIKNNLSVEYLHQIDTSEISDYIQRRKSEVSNGTINRELVILSSLFTKCHLWKYKTPDVKPCKFKLKEKAENIKYLQNWDIASTIIERASPHLKPIIYTALYTGLRRSNILKLKWQELDFVNNLINVKVKDRTKDGGKNLTIPMIDKLKEILLEQPKINEYVFNHKGNPISDIKHSWRSIFYSFIKIEEKDIKDDDVIEWRKIDIDGEKVNVPYKRVLKDPALPYTNFHTLRHTAATWILKKTNNLKITQEILGHSNITTTMKYAHVMSEEKRKALNSVFE